MSKIIGNTTATPNPRPDWNQTDANKADYIKNKPDTLPNPHALTFTGAATGTYDGSGATTINIPVNDGADQVALHNEDPLAHEDIREEISQLSSEKVDKTEVAIMVETEVEDAKGSIVQSIIDELQGLPVFGVVDENNIITVTNQLSNGTYTLRYENADGTLTPIGTITIGSGEPESTTYEVDIASIGYTDDARWSTSSGDIRTGVTGYTAINKIPLNRASGQTATITLSGITWTDDALASQGAYILMYIGDSFTSGHNMPLKGLPKNYDTLGVSGVLNSDGTITITVVDGSEGLYDGFKLCGVGSGANAKVTITIQ